MQSVLRKLSFISIILVIANTFTYSQTLNYELKRKNPLTSNTNDTVRFTAQLPNGFDFCKFEFTPNAVATVVVDREYTFTAPNNALGVTLYYTTTGGDCTDLDLGRTSKVFSINPRLAHFTVGYDISLDTLATLKRVIRSSQNVASNEFAAVGNYRYFWTFDANMIPAPSVNFDNSDLTKGQYPNVYYTFPNGGVYNISLRVTDVSNADITALHSKSVRLTPVFGADKIDFEYIPNVFTPGGNLNNLFKVETSGTCLLQFKVFSRAGALVYQYQGNVIKWDGKNYYGQDLPEGIYYYTLEDISADKKYNPAKGFFYIYR